LPGTGWAEGLSAGGQENVTRMSARPVPLNGSMGPRATAILAPVAALVMDQACVLLQLVSYVVCLTGVKPFASTVTPSVPRGVISTYSRHSLVVLSALPRIVVSLCALSSAATEAPGCRAQSTRYCSTFLGCGGTPGFGWGVDFDSSVCLG